MMLTTEQAKRTWCPMVRIARHEVTEQRTLVDAKSGMEMVSQQDHIVAGCNTDALGRNRVPASCCCIADGCAMWRWGIVEATEPPPAPLSLWRRIVSYGSYTKVRYQRANVGYCGIAGRPAA